MAIKHKIICDRCGKEVEIEDPHNFYITITLTSMPQRVFDGLKSMNFSRDLCPGCYDDFHDIIENFFEMEDL